MDDDSDICECACHVSHGLVHFIPCCAECMYCGENISIGRYDKHLRWHCMVETVAIMIGVPCL